MKLRGQQGKSFAKIAGEIDGRSYNDVKNRWSQISRQIAALKVTARVAFKYDTLDNTLLNMPIGMSIGWGIAYRYLLTPSIGMRIFRSIPIAWTNRSREIGTIRYCS